MSDTRKPRQGAHEAKTPANQPKLTELSPEQLDKVAGGACVKGEHLKEATITHTTSTTSSSSG